MRILVVPETLRAQAVQLRQAALSLEELHQQVQCAWADLDREVRGQAQVEMPFTQARRQALALQEEFETLLFKMPLLGSEAEAGMAFLKILAPANPVQ